MPAYNFSLCQGQTFCLSIGLTDDNNIPIDLTTNQISGSIKTHFSDKVFLTDLGVQIVNATGGLISLNIPASGTAALPVNYAFYDLSMFNSQDNSTNKILWGMVSVYPEITF